MSLEKVYTFNDKHMERFFFLHNSLFFGATIQIALPIWLFFGATSQIAFDNLVDSSSKFHFLEIPISHILTLFKKLNTEKC